MDTAIAKTARVYEAWRISPNDGNRLAFVFDPVADGAAFVAARCWSRAMPTPSSTCSAGSSSICRPTGLA